MKQKSPKKAQLFNFLREAGLSKRIDSSYWLNGAFQNEGNILLVSSCRTRSECGAFWIDDNLLFFQFKKHDGSFNQLPVEIMEDSSAWCIEHKLKSCSIDFLLAGFESQIFHKYECTLAEWLNVSGMLRIPNDKGTQVRILYVHQILGVINLGLDSCKYPFGYSVMGHRKIK